MVHMVNSTQQCRQSRWNDLMRSSQEGDKIAYEQLLTELVPLLRRVIARRWRDQNEVEDLVQDVLLSIHGVRHTFDPSRAFMPWLMTITRRRIADAARRQSHRHANETTVDVMPETIPFQDTNLEQEAIEIGDDIRYAMSVLPTAQREAVVLMKVEGLTLKEASDVTGKSVASLKVTVHRALKTMRQVLK